MENKKLAIKKNLSSLQVLKTFKTLLYGDYTMNELIAELNKNEIIPIFNNSVISKYINTCRYCGIEIPKINHKYTITSIPFGINIDWNDYEIIKEIQATAEKLLLRKNYNDFKNFWHYLCKFTNKNIENNVEKIKKIKLSENEIESLKNTNTVIFKIKGELVKRYHLRENEYIIEEDLPNSITIVNRDENKDILLSRLFRYAELCEIEHPVFYREEMKLILKNALLNYGEIINEK